MSIRGNNRTIPSFVGLKSILSLSFDFGTPEGITLNVVYSQIKIISVKVEKVDLKSTLSSGGSKNT